MRRLAPAALVLGALLAGCGPPVPELPLPDTSRLEPAVRERIRETWAAATETPSGESLLEYGKVLMAHSLDQPAAFVLAAGADLGGPTEFESRYLAGHAAKLTSLDDAAREMSAALEVRGDYGPGHNALGEVLFELERFDEAEAAFQRAWDLEPTSHALVGLARVSLVRGDATRAVEYLEKARAGAPGQMEVIVLLARAYDECGRAELAARAAQDAAGLVHQTATYDPIVARVQDAVVSYAGLVDRAASVAGAGETEKAFELLRKAASLYPERALAYLKAGSLLYQLGEYGDALQAFDQALDANPRHSRALARRGLALMALGREADAESAFRESLAIAPGQLYARRGLLRLLRARNDPAALEVASSLVRDAPEDLAMRLELARMLVDRGDPAAAREHVRFVLKRTPENADARALALRIDTER